MKIGLERLREAKNEVKRGPEKLGEQKMSQQARSKSGPGAFKGARLSLTGGRIL